MEHERMTQVADNSIDYKLNSIYKRIVEASRNGKSFIYVTPHELNYIKVVRLKELGYRVEVEQTDPGFGYYQISWI